MHHTMHNAWQRDIEQRRYPRDPAIEVTRLADQERWLSKRRVARNRTRAKDVDGDVVMEAKLIAEARPKVDLSLAASELRAHIKQTTSSLDSPKRPPAHVSVASKPVAAAGAAPTKVTPTSDGDYLTKRARRHDLDLVTSVSAPAIQAYTRRRSSTNAEAMRRRMAPLERMNRASITNIEDEEEQEKIRQQQRQRPRKGVVGAGDIAEARRRITVYVSAGEIFMRTLDATDEAYEEACRIRKKIDAQRCEDEEAREEEASQGPAQARPLGGTRARRRPQVASRGVAAGPSGLVPESINSSVLSRAPWEAERVSDSRYVESVRL